MQHESTTTNNIIGSGEATLNAENGVKTSGGRGSTSNSSGELTALHPDPPGGRKGLAAPTPILHPALDLRKFGLSRK